jgi:hypothetical protein
VFEFGSKEVQLEQRTMRSHDYLSKQISCQAMAFLELGRVVDQYRDALFERRVVYAIFCAEPLTARCFLKLI